MIACTLYMCHLYLIYEEISDSIVYDIAIVKTAVRVNTGDQGLSGRHRAD